MAKFRLHDGRITTRSTKQRARHAAQTVATEWEHAAKLARSGELTRATIQTTISWLMERTTGETVDDRSVKQFLNDWLNAGDRRPGTLARYKPVIDHFVAFLGSRRASARVASVTAPEIEKFRDNELAQGKSASTANLALSVLRSAFGEARRHGVCLTNPAEGVRTLNQNDADERIPFERQQVRDILAAANKEWQGMILFGLQTGIRIGDAAKLTWANIDLAERTLSFRDSKTSPRKAKAKQTTTVFLHSDVVEYLESLPISDQPDAALFPSLANKTTGSHAGLSNEFGRLMKKAGVRAPLGAEKHGKGRQFSALGFHSFRHTLVSNLANAEVPADVRKQITGHTNDATHARYVHLDLSLQRRAIAQLPSVCHG